MTPSIIRRFARYHGVELVVHEDAVHWALEEIAKALHGSVAPHCVLKVAQSITRIEDAEMLAWSMAQEKPRAVQNALDLERHALLLRAGIDPELWVKVKE